MANITKNGAPDKYTVGAVGDICTNTLTGEVYECVYVYTFVGEKTRHEYDWKKVNDAGFVNISTRDNGANDNGIHISFDDVELCIKNLVNKAYSSLFEEPFLNKLNTLHEKYGAKFTLYVYFDVLATLDDRYKKDFYEAKEWLKIGLHSANGNHDFINETAKNAKTLWNSFIERVITVTGSVDAIDRVPRLHMFGGNIDALVAMRNCEYGALGFLSADDSRSSYYLNSTQNEYLGYRDSLIDIKNGLVFFHTDMRVEWFDPSFNSSYQYERPIKPTMYDELTYRYNTIKYSETFRNYILFTHEWKIYNGSTFTDYISLVEDACRFAYDYGIAFIYPQNKIPSYIASLYIEHAALLDEIQNINKVPQTATVIRKLTIHEGSGFITSPELLLYDYNDASLVTSFTAGYSVRGMVTTPGISPVIGRATMIDGGFTGDLDGKTVSLRSYTLSDGTSLSYSVWYGTSPEDTITSTSNYLISDQNDFKASKWLTESVILPTSSSTNNRMLFIGIKKGDGSVDFTDSELREAVSLINIY